MREIEINAPDITSIITGYDITKIDFTTVLKYDLFTIDIDSIVEIDENFSMCFNKTENRFFYSNSLLFRSGYDIKVIKNYSNRIILYDPIKVIHREIMEKGFLRINHIFD